MAPARRLSIRHQDGRGAGRVSFLQQRLDPGDSRFGKKRGVAGANLAATQRARRAPAGNNLRRLGLGDGQIAKRGLFHNRPRQGVAGRSLRRGRQGQQFILGTRSAAESAGWRNGPP